MGERTFDVLVHDHPIATTSLDSNHRAEFYQRAYCIPRNLTHGKQRITVKFLLHPSNTAGGLFGFRTIDPE